MLAKRNSRNQITLPKAIIADFEGTDYFDVTQENGRIVLDPVRSAPRNWSLADAESYMEKLRLLKIPAGADDPQVLLERMNNADANAEAARAHMDRLGITEQDIADAIAWARRG